MDTPTYKTEDGVTLAQGDRAYNYYDMKPGYIGEPGFSDGWFDFWQDDGTRTLLNGQRICSIEYAYRRGFLKYDKEEADTERDVRETDRAWQDKIHPQ